MGERESPENVQVDEPLRSSPPSTSSSSSISTSSENTAGPSTSKTVSESSLVATDFCWVCNLPGPIFQCTNCPRMYHGRCPFKMPGYPVGTYTTVKKGEQEMETLMDICPECMIAKTSNMTTLKNQPDLVKDICAHVVQLLKEDVLKGENPFISLAQKKDVKYVRLMKKVMDLEILEEAVTNGEIVTPEGFLGELKWLLHNTIIWDGMRLSASHVVPNVEEVRKLIYRCKLEMCDATACPRWYILITDKTLKESVKFKEFIKPCNPPHLLVWVKVEGFPWWPAKLRYPYGDGSYSVAFFRDFKPGRAKANDLRLLSEEPPTPYKGSGKVKPKLNEAMRDLARHVNALKDMYGTVKLAKQDAPMPEVNKITKEVLRIMFPEFVEAAEA